MSRLVLTLTLMIFSHVFYTQNTYKDYVSRPLNSIYLNFLGDASWISLNYERLFLTNSNMLISSKIGLGYNEEFKFGGSSPDKYITIPHHYTLNSGKGRHFFEFGVGGTVICGNTSQPYLFYPLIGYRLIPLKSNKFSFRIFGHIPFSGMDTDDIIFVPVGLNAGINF